MLKTRVSFISFIMFTVRTLPVLYLAAVVVIVMGFGSKGLEFKFNQSTIGIRHERYSGYKVLRCSSKKSGSRASV